MPHLVRKEIGREQRHDAEHVGRPDAEPEERIHVGAAMTKGVPRAPPDEISGPENHRCGEDELAPAPPRGRVTFEREARHAGHRGDEHGKRERAADPELAREFAEFGVIVFGFVAAGLDGLKRHSAFRAIAGMILAHLRVHRAGVDHFSSTNEGGVSLQSHAALGAVAGLVGFDAGTHRAKVFGGGRGFHVGVVVMVVTLGVVFAVTAVVSGGFRRFVSGVVALTLGALGVRVVVIVSFGRVRMWVHTIETEAFT